MAKYTYEVRVERTTQGTIRIETDEKYAPALATLCNAGIDPNDPRITWDDASIANFADPDIPTLDWRKMLRQKLAEVQPDLTQEEFETEIVRVCRGVICHLKLASASVVSDDMVAELEAIMRDRGYSVEKVNPDRERCHTGPAQDTDYY